MSDEKNRQTMHTFMYLYTTAAGENQFEWPLQVKLINYSCERNGVAAGNWLEKRSIIHVSILHTWSSPYTQSIATAYRLLPQPAPKRARSWSLCIFEGKMYIGLRPLFTAWRHATALNRVEEYDKYTTFYQCQAIYWKCKNCIVICHLITVRSF